MMNCTKNSNRVTETILNLIKEWGVDPYDINNGRCEEFALEVIKQIPEAIDVQTESFDGEDTKLPGHVWILYQDKHYDAECPEGVSDWKDLPIFKKLNKDS